MIYVSNYVAPIGNLTIAVKENQLVGLWIENQKYFFSNFKEEVESADNLEIIVKIKKWLDRYFNGERPNINELAIKLVGSDFRKNVWNILCQIPYGEVITYKTIAKKMAVLMDKPHMSAQAIGGAVGHNPISIIIPCHRVVGTNNSLTGYAGGIDTKIKLLILEGVDTTSLFMP